MERLHEGTSSERRAYLENNLPVTQAMSNALTFDVEDYFQVSAFAGQIDPSDWDSHDSRLEANMAKILGLLDERGCRATFFILGWVALKHPQVVAQIAACGHEIACHSHKHRLVYQMTPEEFREDTYSAKSALEDVSGQPVIGYRAPSFSITSQSMWALDVLAKLGFSYDSSIFPVRHPNYGMPGAPASPFRVDSASGSIVEFPLPTISFAGRRSPFGGGAYFRLLPYWYTRWAIRFVNQTGNRQVCVYLHPWELDPAQPRISANWSARIRHYLGLRGVAGKLKSLLRDFEFRPLREVAEQFRELDVLRS
jgi:polysaccharide deacetylase family protein (PEP-CTERM system associated)